MSSDESLGTAPTHHEFRGAVDHDSKSGTFRLFSGINGWRAFAGYTSLAITIFLWTLTNFLASTIFADDTYSKPFLVTYVNSFFFVLAAIPILLYKIYQNPKGPKRWMEQLRLYRDQRYTPLQSDESRSEDQESPIFTASTSAQADSPYSEVRLGSTLETSTEFLPKGGLGSDTGAPALTVWQTAELSMWFSPIWFLANYFVAACLQYTTVGSATILTSSSSVFTLAFGALLQVEKFTFGRLFGVLASLVGIILVSSMDLSGKTNDDEHRGDFPKKSSAELAVGNFLALLSAVMYGFYAAFLKKRVPDESRLDMPLFFCFVGLFNVLLLWPAFFLLHITEIEPFELPPDGRVLSIVIGNSLGSLVSDMSWAYAVLCLSPIVVTVGLSLAIPITLLVQAIVKNQRVGLWYWLGACVVILSFIIVDYGDKSEDLNAVINDEPDTQAT